MRRFSPKKKPSLPDHVEIEIDRFSHDGRGIGHYQGRVVMVSGGLPGEHCAVKIEQGNSKLWQGKAISIEQPSPNRVEPICPVYNQCGGCQQQHIAHKAQIEVKENTIREQFSRQQISVAKLEAPILSTPFQYRHRARFHVAPNGIVGFHGQKDHRVVAIKQCPVLVPALQLAFSQLQDDAPLQNIEQLELVVDDRGKLGLSILKGKQTAVRLLEAWANQRKWVLNEPLTYDSNEVSVFANPGDFTQVNRDVNVQMIQQIGTWLSPSKSDKLLDLFCGNGNIGLAFAANVASVLGLESSASSINQARLASTAFNNAQFAEENLFTSDLHRLQSVQQLTPTIVVLDPPRAGAERACEALSKLASVHRVLYVSCDPATLARDVRTLVNNKWHLRKVGLIDMFPQTRHIETMVLLEK